MHRLLVCWTFDGLAALGKCEEVVQQFFRQFDSFPHVVAIHPLAVYRVFIDDDVCRIGGDWLATHFAILAVTIPIAFARLAVFMWANHDSCDGVLGVDGVIFQTGVFAILAVVFDLRVAVLAAFNQFFALVLHRLQHPRAVDVRVIAGLGGADGRAEGHDGCDERENEVFCRFHNRFVC